MRNLFIYAGVAAALLFTANSAHAWGRRGHALIGETAAALAMERTSPKAPSIFRDKAFDLGYYANVPDLCWKKPESGALESKEHYADVEIFERDVKDMPLEAALQLDRAEFDKRYPGTTDKAGKALWRIRELMGKLNGVATQLKATDLTREKRQELQGEWLVLAGTIGHYIGDFGMPLHVSENHDGQLTDQKGIHGFYEETVVDTFKPGELESEVYKKAASIKRNYAKKSVFDVVYSLVRESYGRMPKLLKIDKKIGRENMKKARESYRSLMVEGMASSSVVLAELWSRNAAWDYDGKKFYNFTPYPIHIVPGADPAVK